MINLIHEAIRLIRIYQDRPQHEVAKEIGFVNSWVSETEKGKKKVTEEMLKNFAAVYNVEVEDIISLAKKLQSNENFRKETFSLILDNAIRGDE